MIIYQNLRFTIKFSYIFFILELLSVSIYRKNPFRKHSNWSRTILNRFPLQLICQLFLTFFYLIDAVIPNSYAFGEAYPVGCWGLNLGLSCARQTPYPLYQCPSPYLSLIFFLLFISLTQYSRNPAFIHLVVLGSIHTTSVVL